MEFSAAELAQLRTIQAEQMEWQERNFGKNGREHQGGVWCLVGIVEELGEFDEAVGIEKIKDAAGDVMVYTLGLCNRRGWDLASILEAATAEPWMLEMDSVHLGRLAHAMLKQHQGIRGTWQEHDDAAKVHLGKLLTRFGFTVTMRLPIGTNFSLLECLEYAWAEVKLRAWDVWPGSGVVHEAPRV